MPDTTDAVFFCPRCKCDQVFTDGAVVDGSGFYLTGDAARVSVEGWGIKVGKIANHTAADCACHHGNGKLVTLSLRVG